MPRRILANASASRERSSDVLSKKTRKQRDNFWQQNRLEETTTTIINERESTNTEVEVVEEEEFRLTFNDLALPEHIVLGLQKCGFVYPSPVQVSAIPLERLGRDCLVQAKSGTGKTIRVRVRRLLDSVLLTKGEEVAEENVMDERNSSVKAMCVVPTREIAIQMAGVSTQLTRRSVAGSSKRSIQTKTVGLFFWRFASCR